MLVGPRAKIERAAAEAGLDISALPLDPTEHSRASAARAVELVRGGRADALMKGSLHTDELMSAVVNGATGLRTARRLSHCFVMEVPGARRFMAWKPCRKTRRHAAQAANGSVTSFTLSLSSLLSVTAT